MLTVIIGICAFVVIGGALHSGEIGAAAVTVVVVLLLIFMSGEERKDTKAWLNMRDYWADGGPDRRRRR